MVFWLMCMVGAWWLGGLINDVLYYLDVVGGGEEDW